MSPSGNGEESGLILLPGHLTELGAAIASQAAVQEKQAQAITVLTDSYEKLDTLVRGNIDGTAIGLNERVRKLESGTNWVFDVLKYLGVAIFAAVLTKVLAAAGL